MNNKVYKRISMFLAFAMVMSSVMMGMPSMVRAEVVAGEVFVETFDNYANNLGEEGSYKNGTFIGDNGVEWTYEGGRSSLINGADDYSIDGNGMMFRKPDDGARIYGTIQGGIKEFSVDTKKAFTGSGKRELEVLINNESKGKFILDNENSEAQSFVVEDINVNGEFTLEIKHIGAASSAQTTIDNITWTSYGEDDEEIEEPNLLANGSFEEWEEDSPIGWMGSKSNIAKSAVSKVEEDAQDGNNSLRLTVAASGHKRFSSEPITLEGETLNTLTYWVKGSGEIRNAYFSDTLEGNGYSAYSEYTTVNSTEWEKVEYTFNHALDADDVEIIFSVRNTVAETHLQIDNIILVSESEAGEPGEPEEPILKVSEVTATPNSGEVAEGSLVTLDTATEGATIHFTIDGQAPTTESDIYTDPIEITEPLTIKAIAVKDGMDNSDISTFNYTHPVEIPEGGDGTWDNPYTVAQSVVIQDKSIATVKGYIVGAPTGEKAVEFENFTSNTALAIADTPGETDTDKMLYVQLAPGFREEFALKDHPERKGMTIKVTGSLEKYFGPHPGIKSITAVEQVYSTPDTTPPVIEHTAIERANRYLDLKISAKVTDDRKIKEVKLYYRTKDEAEYKVADMKLDSDMYEYTIPSIELDIKGLEYYIAASDEDNTSTMPVDKNNPFEIEMFEDDVLAPEITNLKPAKDSSIINNPRPEISAEYSDISGIDLERVKLYLDNIDVTEEASVLDHKITYMPKTDLAEGTHEIRLEVWDKASPALSTIVEWNFYLGQRDFKFYFGQLHSHTNLSDGAGTPDDAYAWARDNGKADFFAVTDHSNWFDNDTGSENITEVSQSTSEKWRTLNAKADEYNEDGDYVAIAGYEMTWSGSTGGWGHMNTFNTPWFASRTNKNMGLKEYYAKIAEWPESINQLNHPGKTFGDFADFGFYSKAADDVVQLIEVGNGEGPIRGSGYFPSYEYYTRALDKGWHLAPSNNQDNHKGNWVTSNEARNVVISDSLSRDSIYQGIREMRSYATENKNLEIMYKVNDQIMGSQLSGVEKLNFSIQVREPDTDDPTQKISKIEVISNGGVVSASKEFGDHNVDWNFELDPQFDYYYTRVIQVNGDISVTAPVWVGEVLPVGLAGLDVSSDYFELGTRIDLSASIYNNGETILTKTEVEFYLGSIAPENLIGKDVVENIGQGSTAKATIEWTASAAGEFNIYAVAKIQGVDKQFTTSTKVEVIPVGSAMKVMIDHGHKNHYVSGGDYANLVESMKEMIKGKDMLVVENHGELRDEVLEDIAILIITSPQPIDRGEVPKSKLSDDEVQAVKRFTDRGGSLVLTSRANYSDGKGDYQNSIQGNKLLNAIGSNIIFNSDQVIDYTSNGGQEYRLYFDKYPTSQYGLNTGLGAEDLYSFYSGSSVLLKDGGNPEKVDFLVQGHLTTENNNAGNVEVGHIPATKGEVYLIAAEELAGGGKIVASGTTFFSDFEMAGDNRYTNIDIASNILDWMKPVQEVELKTIGEVRAGMPGNFGQKFAIEGRVTSMSEAYSQEHNLNNTFFEVIYVQDQTGGMTIFGVSNTKLPLGTKVRIIGTADEYQGDYQLRISDEGKDLIILDQPIQEVEAKTMSTKDSMLKSNEGLLVKVQGRVTEVVIDGGETNLYIDDGTGVARVYVQGYIGDGSGNPDTLGQIDKDIKVGDLVSAIGLASSDPVGPRLRVRNSAEIVKEKEAVESEYPLITDNVEIVEDGENTIIRVNVENTTQATIKGSIILKLIDDNGRAYKVISQISSMVEGKTLVTFTVKTADYPKGIKEIKVYIWDSLDNMKALAVVKQ